MKLTVGKRLALEILGPPFLGTFIFMVVTSVEAKSFDPVAAVVVFFVVLMWAYVIAGMPSLLYAAVMEVAFALKLRPGSWAAVILSSLLGLAVGLGLTWLLGGRNDKALFPILLTATGGMVGFILGYLVRVFSPKEDVTLP